MFFLQFIEPILSAFSTITLLDSVTPFNHKHIKNHKLTDTDSAELPVFITNMFRRSYIMLNTEIHPRAAGWTQTSSHERQQETRLKGNI